MRLPSPHSIVAPLLSYRYHWSQLLPLPLLVVLLLLPPLSYRFSCQLSLPSLLHVTPLLPLLVALLLHSLSTALVVKSPPPLIAPLLPPRSSLAAAGVAPFIATSH